mgnify:CR=1 FL=1
MRTTSSGALGGHLAPLFLALPLASSPVIASSSIDEMVCADKDFLQAGEGMFREVPAPDQRDSIYVFKISAERLKTEGLKGAELSAVARNFAAQEFSKRFAKRSPPGTGMTVLVSEGVQSIAAQCRTGTTILIWVSRSKLRWEAVKDTTPRGVMEEARRMIDGGAVSPGPSNKVQLDD